jgi:hypothetical protein
MNISSDIIEKVLRYCEDQQIYDKLGNYGDFYYKLKRLINDEINVNHKL